MLNDDAVAGSRKSSSPASPSQAYDLDNLERISCSDCGRTFATIDGPGMMAEITGCCPGCGGSFKLVGTDAKPN